MPKPRPKQIIRLSILLTVLTAGTLTTLLITQARQLASPDRRPLQPYHLDYLQNAKNHGIQIKKLTCLTATTPTLLVTPDPKSTLGKRGTLIRQQLATLGHTLSPNGAIRANLVLLHGRNGRKEDLLPVAERFCAAGFRCIIPDLPAHGESTIKVSHFGLKAWEKQMPANVLKECAQHFNFPEKPSALWGMSMGGSFATAAASNSESWSSLTIVSSFDQLDKVIKNKCHSKTLAAAISKISQHQGGPDITKVTPYLWAEKIHQPVLVAHGTNDELIDLKSAQNLFHSFPTTDKHWIEVKGATHSNILTTPLPLYSIMADWALTHLTPQNQLQP